MNMKLFKSNWILGALVALSLGGTYTTVGLTKDFGNFKEFKELNLTAEQKAKLKELRSESKKDHKQERAKMKEEGKAFREKMAGDASEDELRKDFEKMQTKRSEMAKQRFDHMLKVRSILTPEQRQKFAEMMDKKMKGKKGKWGHKARGKKSEADEDESDEE